MTSNRVFGLDLLRALAIGLVLLAHTLYLLPLSASDQEKGLGYLGFIGVELFFVLSGYLISGILFRLFDQYGTRWATFRYFWIRRWFRTLPAYYLALLLYTALFYFSQREPVWQASYYPAYFFFVQNWVHPHPSFFPLAWSLSVEEWFYLFLPFFIVLCQWVPSSKQRSVGLVIGLLLVLFPLVRGIWVQSNAVDWNFGLRMRVPFRFDALLWGVLMQWVLTKYQITQSQSRWWALAGAALLIGGSLYYWGAAASVRGEASLFSGSIYFSMISAGVACWIPWLIQLKEPAQAIWRMPVRFLSQISYSLYLTHIFSIYVVTTVLNKAGMLEGYVFTWIASWIGSILVAAVLYRYFEKPMMDLRDNFSPPSVRQ